MASRHLSVRGRRSKPRPSAARAIWASKLTPGKRADLIMLDASGLNLTNNSDLYVDRLLMAAQPSNVDTVVV